MLLRRRVPRIDSRAASTTRSGFNHLDRDWLVLLRWLQASQVDFVLVGAAAEAMRGGSQARGPLAIVPAPYRRNYARLADALSAAGARQRTGQTDAGEAQSVPVRLTAEKLSRGSRWQLRCDRHDLDIEAVAGVVAGADGENADAGPPTPPGSRYQELLYEASRVEPDEGVAVEVASPEDIEHYRHLARTGEVPELTVARADAGDRATAPQPD